MHSCASAGVRHRLRPPQKIDHITAWAKHVEALTLQQPSAPPDPTPSKELLALQKAPGLPGHTAGEPAAILEVSLQRTRVGFPCSVPMFAFCQALQQCCRTFFDFVA